MITKDSGFILKRWNFRETSLFISAYTLKYGKITGLLKGFYSPKKEFTSILEPMTLNEFIFYPRRSEIWLVSFADLINDYSQVRYNLSKNRIASVFLQILYRNIELHEPNEEIFTLLKETLDLLSKMDDEKILSIFLIKFLTIAGIKPQFNLCLNCHTPYGRKLFFSMQAGGIICDKCSNKNSDIHPITKETTSTIHYIQHNRFPQLLRLKPSLRCKEEIIYIVGKFIEYHLHLSLPFLYTFK